MTPQRTDHVKTRAAERYCRDLNRSERRTIAALIRDGKGVLLCHHRRSDGTLSDNCEQYAVEFDSRWFAVLYDFKRQEVASILPPFVVGRYWDKIEESLKPKTLGRPRMTEEEMAELCLRFRANKRPHLGL